MVGGISDLGVGWLILIIGFLIVIVIGGYKAFQRKFVVAILCAIFLAPIFTIWCFVELFTKPLEKKDQERKIRIAPPAPAGKAESEASRWEKAKSSAKKSIGDV